MNPGSCIHFTGVQHKKCKLGYVYDSLTKPLPCMRSYTVHWPKERRGQQEPCKHTDCKDYLAPTPEQLAEDEKRIKAAMDRMLRVNAGIAEWRKAHKGKSAQNVIECPECKGRLHLSIAAYNGHVHGRCETAGCVSWME